VVFVGRLIHEIKNPTNNETWVAVWHPYIAMLSSNDLDFLDQLHRGQLTILITAYLLMGYNPHEHVCEWFDFECMCKNDRNVYLWKDSNNLR
jgi:hypothetical protein